MQRQLDAERQMGQRLHAELAAAGQDVQEAQRRETELSSELEDRDQVTVLW